MCRYFFLSELHCNLWGYRIWEIFSNVEDISPVIWVAWSCLLMPKVYSKSSRWWRHSNDYKTSLIECHWLLLVILWPKLMTRITQRSQTFQLLSETGWTLPSWKHKFSEESFGFTNSLTFTLFPLISVGVLPGNTWWNHYYYYYYYYHGYKTFTSFRNSFWKSYKLTYVVAF